jgi:AbrB family looped-hinge helix DNA binding protein
MGCGNMFTYQRPRHAYVGDRRLPSKRPPTHPGEMLVEEFLKPLGISQSAFAVRLGVSFRIVIPKAIRESLRLAPGQRLRAIAFENRIQLIPLRPGTGMAVSATPRPPAAPPSPARPRTRASRRG